MSVDTVVMVPVDTIAIVDSRASEATKNKRDRTAGQAWPTPRQVALDSKNPPGTNGLASWRQPDELEGPILNEGLDLVLGSLEPAILLVLGQLVDLRDAPRLAKVLLVRFERILGHRVKSILQGFVIGQKILVFSRIDVLDACYHRPKRALEGVLMVTPEEVEFVVARGRRGRQDIAETRWRWYRSSWERRRIDWSINERIR